MSNTATSKTPIDFGKKGIHRELYARLFGGEFLLEEAEKVRDLIEKSNSISAHPGRCTYVINTFSDQIQDPNLPIEEPDLSVRKDIMHVFFKILIPSAMLAIPKPPPITLVFKCNVPDFRINPPIWILNPIWNEAAERLIKRLPESQLPEVFQNYKLIF